MSNELMKNQKWFGGKYGPFGSGSKAGRWWDTWIGRRGFFQFLGGKDADRKSRAIKGINREIGDLRSRLEGIVPNEMGSFNTRNMNDWSALMGKNTESPLTMATDTGKNQNFQNTIQMAINNTNTGLLGSIEKAQNRVWSQEDRIADLKAEKQTIRNS